MNVSVGSGIDPDDTKIINPRSASNIQEHKRIFSLCHFAITKQLCENECEYVGRNALAG